MQKRWSKAEIAHLERHAEDESLEELAQKFHTDVTTVERKLAELGHRAERAQHQAEDDEALRRYTEALRRLYAGEWSRAIELLEPLVDDGDNPELVDRARQHLELAKRRLATAVEGSEPYEQAVVAKNRGNYQAALEICVEQGDAAERDERWAFLRASLRSLLGQREEALADLATAIRLEPKNRVHAYHDPDFEAIRGQAEFLRLLAGTEAKA